MRRGALILAMGLAIAACSGGDEGSDAPVEAAGDHEAFAEAQPTTAGAEAAPPSDGTVRSPSTSKSPRIAK